MTNGSLPKRGEQFAQHSGLFGVTGHAIHLGLQIGRRDWPLPVDLPGAASCADNLRPFFSICRARHHFIERRFWSGIFFRPNPVTPIDFFNRVLIGHAFGEGQAGALLHGLALPLGSKSDVKVTRLTRKRHTGAPRILLVISGGRSTKEPIYLSSRKRARLCSACEVTTFLI